MDLPFWKKLLGNCGNNFTKGIKEMKKKFFIKYKHAEKASKLDKNKNLYDQNYQRESLSLNKEMMDLNTALLYKKTLERRQILLSAQINIKKMLNKNIEEMEEVLGLFEDFLCEHEVENFLFLLSDIEKVTLLIHTLARKLAIMEIKVAKSDLNENGVPDELKQKMESIANKIDETCELKKKLHLDFQNFLNSFDCQVEHETVINFKIMMEAKIKLIITLREIQDKTKIVDTKIKSFE